MDILTGVASGVASSTISSVVIAPLIQLIDDVLRRDENTRLLQDQLNRMKALLQDINSQIQHEQRSPPDTLQNWLQRLHHSLEDAKGVIDRAQQHRWCLGCIFCKPRLAKQIREWNTNFDQLFSNLERDISIFRRAQQTVSSAPLQAEALLQIVPESGFVGCGIKDGEMQLRRWLDNEDPQFRIMGIYGMGGIGKTALLKTIYNAYKTGKLFEAVIWTTVSQTYNIAALQSSIAEEIHLNLGSTTSNAESSSAVDMRKRKLYACLRQKKFLLVLDDMWRELQLDEELGIPVGNDRGSRVLISTRSFDVIRRMGADDFSIEVQPLSRDEGWQLFCRGAFRPGSALTKDIEDVATQIAGECNGLPLAINVVAAAMKGKISVNEWYLALNQMKNMDPVFLGYSGVGEGLYSRLKWSYDCLPDSVLKNCFLYCATFPEDWWINENTLVEIWIGEGLVNSRETSYLMDVGFRYVELLVERCLFQSEYDDDGHRMIQVHDAFHDLAMYVAEKEEQCLFRTRQNLQKFPGAEKGINNCKRIAIGHNNISVLPTDFRCPNLLTLMLQYNQSLREVPDGFLINLTSLRVLNLSGTKIESLPMSLWHLTQLEYLGLYKTLIKDLPEDICNLSQLQFLDLYGCTQLESLPCTMGQLENLRTLHLSGCCSLTGIPREISRLTSLNILLLWTSGTVQNSIMEVEEVKSGVCTLRDLTNCPNLMTLQVHVKAGIGADGIRSGVKVGTMGSWSEMRDLTLVFDVEDDDVVEDLPQDMQSMKKLQRFGLQNYHGRSLPNCICEFPQLHRLYLFSCFQLGNLPPLERLPYLRVLSLDRCIRLKELGIGTWGSMSGFPRLESLKLIDLPVLESLGSSSSNVVWNEQTMPKLQVLTITDCQSLKELGIGTWGSMSAFPMLESLTLIDLPVLESLGSSSSNVVWNEQTMPKLQVLTITDCQSLKGLPTGIDKLPNLRRIEVQEDWWEKNDVEIFLKEKLHHLVVFVE